MADQALRYTLEIDGIDPAVLARVLGFVVREVMFDGCRSHVQVATLEPIDVQSILGKKATLRAGTENEPRCWHGVVLNGVSAPTSWDTHHLQVEIATRSELLRIGRNSRIFLDKSVQDVVTAVFDEAGLADVLSWEAGTTYDPRPNIVQLNEADHAFVSRLLHEEGIGFYIKNDAATDTLVVFDDSTSIAPEDSAITLIDRDSTQLAYGVVWDLNECRATASDQVMLRDYDLENAKGEGLTVSWPESTEGTTGREVYIHPGNFKVEAHGKRIAERTLERLRMPTRTFRGKSDALEMAVGSRLTITSHPRASLNTDMLVTEVTHQGRDPELVAAETAAYECEFRAIPIDVKFRPQAAPPAPEMPGVLRAFVTCPSGEEIHSEKFGRVKVRFPWDRSGITDDKSSTWLRVGQLALGGSMILPRIDFEVTVSHELGDLDRPFVNGHVYNEELKPPYALPAGKTVSSIQSATTAGGPGANEIRFEDAAGSEEIFANASKDMVITVDNDSEAAVAANETRKIGSNHTFSIGTDFICNVVGDRTLTISGSQNVNVTGDHNDGVNSLKVDIGGNRMVKVGGDHAEDVKADLTRNVGSLQSITALAGYERKITGNSTWKVDAAWAEMCGQSRALSAKSYSETVGALKCIKAKQFSVSCGAAYMMTAAAEKVTCGGNRNDSAKGAVSVAAGGGMTVKAKNIVIGASNKLTLKGGACTITLTSAGMVTIKAPTIILKGAKALNQIMHKSN